MAPRRLLPRLILAVAVAVAVAAAPSARGATAGATPADRAASRAYLGDARAEIAALQAGAARERAAELAFVARVRATCPRIEAGEPTDTAAQQRIQEALTTETVADLAIVAEAPVRHPTSRFIARMARLRWSSGSIDGTARRLERQTRRFLALGPSRLCADIRFSAHHHWRRLAPAARRFAAAFAATQKPPPPTVAAVAELMKPYLGPGQRAALVRLTSQVRRAGKRLGRLISNELNAIFAVLD